MFEMVPVNRTVIAFDADEIHAGNRGHSVDHDQVDRQVHQWLSDMSLEQKLNELHGRQPAPIDGLYHAGGDEALGIPAFRMVDGPRGARAGTATAFPVAIARGATFDPALEKQVGLAAGLEVLAKGGNVVMVGMPASGAFRMIGVYGPPLKGGP